MNKFSDFAETGILEGDKIKLDEVLNNEVVALDYKISGSKYKTNSCLTLQIKYNEEKRVIFTGSQVLIDQIKKYEDMLPFKTTIKKINKYYTFT
jgi:IS4 transposase